MPQHNALWVILLFNDIINRLDAVILSNPNDAAFVHILHAHAVFLFQFRGINEFFIGKICRISRIQRLVHPIPFRRGNIRPSGFPQDILAGKHHDIGLQPISRPAFREGRQKFSEGRLPDLHQLLIFQTVDVIQRVRRSQPLLIGNMIQQAVCMNHLIGHADPFHARIRSFRLFRPGKHLVHAYLGRFRILLHQCTQFLRRGDAFIKIPVDGRNKVQECFFIFCKLPQILISKIFFRHISVKNLAHHNAQRRAVFLVLMLKMQIVLKIIRILHQCQENQAVDIKPSAILIRLTHDLIGIFSAFLPVQMPHGAIGFLRGKQLHTFLIGRHPIGQRQKPHDFPHAHMVADVFQLRRVQILHDALCISAVNHLCFQFFLRLRCRAAHKSRSPADQHRRRCKQGDAPFFLRHIKNIFKSCF